MQVLESNNYRALAIGFQLDDIGKAWLLLTDDLGLYRRLEDLPARWQRQAKQFKITHFAFAVIK